MLLKDAIILLQIRHAYGLFWDNADIAKINGYDISYLRKVNKMLDTVSRLKAGEHPIIDKEIREMSIKFLEEIESVTYNDEMALMCARVMNVMMLNKMLEL